MRERINSLSETEKLMKITSQEIFQELERQAIVWGKQHNHFHVGQIVETQLRFRKKTCFVKLSGILVVIGRNAQKTTRKSLTLQYIGRRMRKNGDFIDGIGSGVVLDKFWLENGESFDGNFNGVNDLENDCGLSFELEFEKEAQEKYPNAYKTYANADYPYQF